MLEGLLALQVNQSPVAELPRRLLLAPVDWDSGWGSAQSPRSVPRNPREDSLLCLAVDALVADRNHPREDHLQHRGHQHRDLDHRRHRLGRIRHRLGLGQAGHHRVQVHGLGRGCFGSDPK